MEVILGWNGRRKGVQTAARLVYGAGSGMCERVFQFCVLNFNLLLGCHFAILCSSSCSSKLPFSRSNRCLSALVRPYRLSVLSIHTLDLALQFFRLCNIDR